MYMHVGGNEAGIWNTKRATLSFLLVGIPQILTPFIHLIL